MRSEPLKRRVSAFGCGRAGCKRVDHRHGWLAIAARLNVNELATVSAWPVGPTSELPVSMIGSRLVAPSAAIRRNGPVIGKATFPGRERPLALTPADSLRHLHTRRADRRRQVNAAAEPHYPGHAGGASGSRH